MPEASERPRIVIADDSMILREGLSRLFSEAGFEVVATYGDADSLMAGLDSLDPDLAVLDIRMPPTYKDEGLRAAIEIRRTRPGTGVLLLSQYAEVAYASELLGTEMAGAGYLMKDRVSSIDELREAVIRIVDGGTVIDQLIVQQMFAQKRAPLSSLTDRESQVLALMAEGRTNQSIATAMNVSIGSVEKYSTAIFGKLQLEADGESHRRVLAVLAWLQAGS
jgi:DNA-binding NarL/FixJ family response regulator